MAGPLGFKLQKSVHKSKIHIYFRVISIIDLGGPLCFTLISLTDNAAMFLGDATSMTRVGLTRTRFSSKRL